MKSGLKSFSENYGPDVDKSKFVNVGRIEPTSKPHFDHGYVDAALNEEIERHRRRRFKKRRAEPIDVGVMLIQPGHHVGFAYRCR